MYIIVLNSISPGSNGFFPDFCEPACMKLTINLSSHHPIPCATHGKVDRLLDVAWFRKMMIDDDLGMENRCVYYCFPL